MPCGRLDGYEQHECRGSAPSGGASPRDSTRYGSKCSTRRGRRTAYARIHCGHRRRRRRRRWCQQRRRHTESDPNHTLERQRLRDAEPANRLDDATRTRALLCELERAVTASEVHAHAAMRTYDELLHGQPSSFHLAAAASRHAFGRSPSPPPRRCHGGSSRRRRPATRAHPCHRARRPEARVRRAARAVAVERAPRCRSSPRASKRGAASAAGAAGGARYNASQAEPRRRRGRSRSLPRARRSPPIRTRPWRPLRPARTLLSLPEVALKRRGES
mmetsp:Transcript_37770/g.125142  ORF Transcript_37770/g.125142 Transcript_37770/m.125142 type:complete len:275 (+) Transcript_37770:389-1213(+)